MVGRPFGGNRLGYWHTVHATRPLAALFAARRRRQHFVRWDDSASTGRAITLNTTVDRLPAHDQPPAADWYRLGSRGSPAEPPAGGTATGKPLARDEFAHRNPITAAATDTTPPTSAARRISPIRRTSGHLRLAEQGGGASGPIGAPPDDGEIPPADQTSRRTCDHRSVSLMTTTGTNCNFSALTVDPPR